MIRKNLLDCKLILNKSAKTSAQSLSQKTKDLTREICPSCGAHGKCLVHGHYQRWIIDFEGGKPHQEQVTITRVKCSSCGHTHALIPDLFIPYGQYSLTFVLHVLCQYFDHQKTADICARFMITVSMLYRWIELFRSHRQEWLGVTDSSDGMHMINIILGFDHFCDFSIRFLELTFISFMQSHKNPANCQQRPPGFHFT